MIRFAGEFGAGESFIHLKEWIDDVDIMTPDDDEEHRVIDCWTLALQSGFSNAETDSGTIALFCERHDLDELDVLRVCKSMTTAFNAAKMKGK